MEQQLFLARMAKGADVTAGLTLSMIYENDESTGEKNEDVKNNESNGKVKKGENENNPMINPFYESEHGESSEEENEDEKYPVKSRCMDHETSKVSIKKHRSIKIPSVKNLLKCQVCNYSTLWKNHLERHNSKHTGERPKYTSERPHSCSLCSLSFKRPNDAKFVAMLLPDKIVSKNTW